MLQCTWSEVWERVLKTSLDEIDSCAAGEAAVHLLGRMLAFDPGRRISAEEALCHEYFAALEASALNEMGESPCLS